MQSFSRGQRSKLSDLMAGQQFKVTLELSGLQADLACFGLDESGKLSDDRYFVFFNQPSSPESAIAASGDLSSGKGSFQIDLGKLPPSIKKLTFTAALDSGTLSSLSGGFLSLSDSSGEKARFEFRGADFGAEKAVMVAEVYFKDFWRFSAVGQGFNGGLKALLEHFGGEAMEESAPPPQTSNAQRPATALQASSAPTPAAPTSQVSLVKQKRIDLDKKLERESPGLVSLVKKAQVSLEKKGLLEHRAKVALCLDISGSMGNLYQSGKIQRLSEKVLALGTRFDDDFSIDIFLFGQNAHEAGSMSPDNFKNFVPGLLRQYPLEGGTAYGSAMQMIRRFYFGRGGRVELPTYVLFLTDGEPHDKDLARRMVQESSSEAIFWQFVGIGKSNKGTQKKKGFFASLFSSDFSFLEELDDLGGRTLDNSNFFSVEDPESIPDEELYDLMLGEYAGWVTQARGRGMIS